MRFRVSYALALTFVLGFGLFFATPLLADTVDAVAEHSTVGMVVLETARRVVPVMVPVTVGIISGVMRGRKRIFVTSELASVVSIDGLFHTTSWMKAFLTANTAVMVHKKVIGSLDRRLADFIVCDEPQGGKDIGDDPEVVMRLAGLR